MFKYLIPDWIKNKLTNWTLQLLNIEIITPEQQEELQELLKKDSDKAFNRMLEIFQETTQRQQKIIKELTEENKELKAKLAEMEKERQEISEELDEVEDMSELYQRDPEAWQKWWDEKQKKN